MIEVLAARDAWCRSEESILWCLPLQTEAAKPYIYYRVSGRDAVGKRRTVGSELGKGLKGAGDFVLGTTLEVVSGTLGEGDDGGSSTMSRAIASGKRRDCLVAQHLSEWQPTNDKNTKLFVASRNVSWVLTDQRLGLLEFESAKESTGLVGAVRGALSGSSEADGARLPKVKAWAEFPRSEIAGLEKVKYKLKGCSVSALRFSFSDGSTLDLRYWDIGGDLLDRLLDMACGEV